jgi:4-hydroxy-2-oxoheptanedioate aldolase
MKGLVAGGPTKSGHRTPAVIVNVPVNGLDEVTVRANSWMFQQVSAPAQIWGISLQEYEQKADPWPLNPDGELLLGVKEEDKYALANVSENLKIPGIGMAEWGPGDMALSLGVPSGRGSVNDPRMQAARSKVLEACKANHVAFLNSLAAADVVDMIQEGVMVGPASQQTAEIAANLPNARCRGRVYT